MLRDSVRPFRLVLRGLNPICVFVEDTPFGAYKKETKRKLTMCEAPYHGLRIVFWGDSLLGLGDL